MTLFDYIWKLCIFALLTAIAIMMAGCVTGHATLPNGAEVKYTRIGNQEIGEFGYDGDNNTFYFERQKADNEALYQAMNKLVDKIP